MGSSSELLRLTGRRRLAREVRRGTVHRLSRGRYALPTASEARRAAGGLSGVVGLRSAAAHHQWPVRTQPDEPEVIVARNAIDVRGAGAAAVRRVRRHADARSANPFESVLRALCLESGLAVEPQGEVVPDRDTVHPDLVCRDRRAAVEGDSWTWHSTRKAHTRAGWACQTC